MLHISVILNSNQVLETKSTCLNSIHYPTLRLDVMSLPLAREFQAKPCGKTHEILWLLAWSTLSARSDMCNLKVGWSVVMEYTILQVIWAVLTSWLQNTPYMTQHCFTWHGWPSSKVTALTFSLDPRLLKEFMVKAKIKNKFVSHSTRIFCYKLPHLQFLFGLFKKSLGKNQNQTAYILS